MHTSADKHRAILLLGPTGAGKTPLGDLLAERGLWEQPCLHFDFGANLREVVRRDRPDDLFSRADLDFLRQLLESGALLENERFRLAEGILRSSLAGCGSDRDTRVVLNGLPRHAGQAEAVDSILTVDAVVRLECTIETVLRRIRTNAGGDRTGRGDDDPAAVRRKLRLFAERTAPLLDYYRRPGTKLDTIEVTSDMTATEMWHILNRRPH